MSALRQNLLKSVVQNKSNSGPSEPRQGHGRRDKPQSSQTSQPEEHTRGSPTQQQQQQQYAQTTAGRRKVTTSSGSRAAGPPFVPDPTSWDRESVTADSPSSDAFQFPSTTTTTTKAVHHGGEQWQERGGRPGNKVSFLSEHSSIPSPAYDRSQASTRSSSMDGMPAEATMQSDKAARAPIRRQLSVLDQIGVPPYSEDVKPEGAQPPLSSLRPGPNPIQQPQRQPHMVATLPTAGGGAPSSRRLRQELYDTLVVKGKRIKLSKRRIRLMEGFPLPFWTFVGMIGGSIAAAILVPLHQKAIKDSSDDDNPTALLLMSVLIPLGILFLGISIGLMMLGLRNNIRRYLSTYAAHDYAETRDLILNLSKLIADVDLSAPPADRNWLLEQASDALTEAILLKRRFEQPTFARPGCLLFQAAAAPLFLITALIASLIITCAGLDEKPRIDQVYQEGQEAALVDRCTLGCCVHITGMGCCCAKAEGVWLARVAQRSSSLEAEGWGSLALHSLV